MSEENQVVGTAIPGESTEGTTQQVEVTTSDPFEQQALEQGWKPKEEWDGDPALWRPAKEFVERGELFQTIHELRSDNKKIREALSFLTDHHKKVKDTEFTRALQVLKAEKKKALEDGDADRLLQVDDAIDIVKQQQAEAKNTVPEESKQPQGPTPTFMEWSRANSWYRKDSEMTDFADEVGVGYYNRNPNASEKDVYDYVAKRVKQAFPDKFKGTAPKTSAVEGNTGTRSSSPNSFQLSDDEKRVMNTFVRQGVMTKEQYIEELKRVKGV